MQQRILCLQLLRLSQRILTAATTASSHLIGLYCHHFLVFTAPKVLQQGLISVEEDALTSTVLGHQLELQVVTLGARQMLIPQFANVLASLEAGQRGERTRWKDAPAQCLATCISKGLMRSCVRLPVLPFVRKKLGRRDREPIGGNVPHRRSESGTARGQIPVSEIWERVCTVYRALPGFKVEPGTFEAFATGGCAANPCSAGGGQCGGRGGGGPGGAAHPKTVWAACPTPTAARAIVGSRPKVRTTPQRSTPHDHIDSCEEQKTNFEV